MRAQDPPPFCLGQLVARINAALLGVGPAPAEGMQTLTQHHGLAGRQHRVAHGALSGLGVQHQAPLIQLDMLQVVPLLLLLLPLGTRSRARGRSGSQGGSDQEGGRTRGPAQIPERGQGWEYQDSQVGVGVAE